MFGQYFRVQIGPETEHRQVLHLQIHMHKLFPLYIEMYLLKEKKELIRLCDLKPSTSAHQLIKNRGGS